MVILDESSKDDRTLIRKYGCALHGNDPVLTVSLDRGKHYSILPALTLDGYIAIWVVKGSINGEEFFDFVVNDLVYTNFSWSTWRDLEDTDFSHRFPAPTRIPSHTVSSSWTTVEHIKAMLYKKSLKLLAVASFFCHHTPRTIMATFWEATKVSLLR